MASDAPAEAIDGPADVDRVVHAFPDRTRNGAEKNRKGLPEHLIRSDRPNRRLRKALPRRLSIDKADAWTRTPDP
jgi:hypothetical protein